MKKNGFTLAETLIALAILGILAAVMLPLINKFRPDVNKVLYLKSYDTLVEATGLIINDRNLYPETVINGNRRFNYSQYPLLNTGRGEFGDFNLDGISKYCKALAVSLNILENRDDIVDAFNGPCSDVTPVSPNQFLGQFNTGDFRRSFTAKNGVEFMVESFSNINANEAVPTGQYMSHIVIDINGEKGPNSVYSNNVRTPDRFRFIMNADGEIRAIDEAGIYYLETRNSYGKKSIVVNDEIRQLLNRNRRVFDTVDIPVTQIQ